MGFRMQHRRIQRATTVGLATAAMVSFVAACGSSGSGGSSASSSSSSSAAKLTGTLNASGSTFQLTFQQQAIQDFKSIQPGMTINYGGGGSGKGRTDLASGTVNFAGSDSPIPATETANFKGKAVLYFPILIGPITVSYNLPGNPKLTLSAPTIAKIFSRKITNWNDPAITALNPKIVLPSAPIFVVHRADGSGTTYIFSNYLSSVDPTWAAKVGTGTTLHWSAPDGEGVQGNVGVADAVAHIPYSIGYIERSYLQGPILAYATIRNQAGQYTGPTPASIAADAAQKPDITPTDFSIVNEPGATSYPISGYSWALLYTHETSQATGQALVNLLNWLTHNGQTNAATLGYVPLPPRIQQLAHTMLQQITGPSGTHLLP